MKKNMLLLALGLSLLFNLFVLLGFARARTISGRLINDEKMVDRVRDELKLDDAQARAFADLRQGHRRNMMVFEGEMALIQQELIAELNKDNPDLDRVRELVEQQAELHRQRRLDGLEMFGKFVGVLTPQQRRGLAARLFGPNQPGERTPPAMLRRFDANGNGRLEPTEFQTARREFENRRREMQDARNQHQSGRP